MDFIRARQKTETRGSAKHCFYGLDADLIMLGLVTHEPKFLLLRHELSVAARAAGAQGSAGVHGGATSNCSRWACCGTCCDCSSTRTGRRAARRRLRVPVHAGRQRLPAERAAPGDRGRVPGPMMSTYKELRPALGGFVSRKEAIHLPRLELVFRGASRPLNRSTSPGGGTGAERAPTSPETTRTRTAAKFGIAPGDAGARRRVVRDYVRGPPLVPALLPRGLPELGLVLPAPLRAARLGRRSTWRTSRSSSPRRPRGRCPRSSNSCPCCRRSSSRLLRNPTPR